MISTPNNKTAGTWLTDLVFLSIVLGILYFLWLGSYPIFTPDEGRYSEVAREMARTGDYITPRLNGVGFFDKPILYYWLQASAINLFGLKEWALRIWPALLGVFCCLAVYMSGRILYSRRAGVISAIILATNIMYFGASHYANMDIEVAVFISTSLLCFIVAMQLSSEPARTLVLLLSYAFSALAILTKGLIGIAFPMMIIGSWILALNRWHVLTKMRIISGTIVLLLIAAPWYLLVQKANPHFLEFFFITQQFSRFLTKGSYNNVSALWFYIPIIVIGFLPWSLFLIQAVSYHIKLIWQNRQKHAVELFILLWFALIFVFFSIPKSKTIGYIAPVFPALALMIGHYFDHHWNRLKSRGLYFGVIGLLILCGITGVAFLNMAPNIFPVDYRLIPYSITAGVILSITAITLYYILKTNQFSKIFYCTTIAASFFLLTFISSAHIINHKTIKPLADIIATELKPDDEVVTYYRYYQDLPIYLEKRITIAANWHAEDIPQYDNWQRELWFNMPYQDTSSWLIEEDEFWRRWQSNKRIFVLMHNEFYNSFVQNLRRYTHQHDLPYPVAAIELGKHDHVILMSNKK